MRGVRTLAYEGRADRRLYRSSILVGLEGPLTLAGVAASTGGSSWGTSMRSTEHVLHVRAQLVVS